MLFPCVCCGRMKQFLVRIVLIFLFLPQVRLESIEAVNKILEEANKRIQPTGTGKITI